MITREYQTILRIQKNIINPRGSVEKINKQYTRAGITSYLYNVFKNTPPPPPPMLLLIPLIGVAYSFSVTREDSFMDRVRSSIERTLSNTLSRKSMNSPRLLGIPAVVFLADLNQKTKF